MAMSAAEAFRRYGSMGETKKRFDGIADAVGSVTNSTEFQRIAALPRRVLDLSQVEDVTPLFQKPGGTMSFRPIQSAALIEAALYNGLFGPIPCGKGKTLILLALPEAMDSEHTVLLVPPKLKRQLLREIDEVYSKHFNLPLDRISIVSYSELSSIRKADILDELQARSPIDLIGADEAHCLKNRAAARTKRFRRFMDAHPETRFVPLSGTMSTRSILECGPLAELALRKGSPYPRGYRELKDWAGALDVRPEYVMAPGVLKRFCTEEDQGDARKGFRRRRDETPGVVSGAGPDDVGATLIIRRLDLKIPSVVRRLIGEVNRKWSIDGDEFDSAMTRARVLRQLACGFYYRWAHKPEEGWLRARTEWHRATREELKKSIRGRDSMQLLARAAERGAWNCPAWAEWKKHKDIPPPPTETVWLDDFMVVDALERAEKAAKGSPETGPRPTIIWYRHRAVGKRLGEVSGRPVYGEGTDLSGTKHDVAIASVAVQSEGRNVQDWYSGNLITSVPPNAGTMEQLISRTHREGQMADEVWVEFYGHTPEACAAMSMAVEQAEYSHAREQAQKIFLATRLDW